MTFFIILLAISQIVGFYLIFNKVKPIIKPKTEGIILKVIPDKPTYESLDPENKLVYDIMESVFASHKLKYLDFTTLYTELNKILCYDPKFIEWSKIELRNYKIDLLHEV